MPSLAEFESTLIIYIIYCYVFRELLVCREVHIRELLNSGILYLKSVYKCLRVNACATLICETHDLGSESCRPYILEKSYGKAHQSSEYKPVIPLRSTPVET